MIINTLAWFGTLVSIIGAFTVASGFFFPGYIAFTLGCFSWLTVAAVRKDGSLALLNVFFLGANILGLYNNF